MEISREVEPMKLVIEIEAPEQEIKLAIKGIPPNWFWQPGDSPVRLMACALKAAYEKYLAQKTE